VKFWDASAIIPLCVEEASSEVASRILKTDEDIVVWWVTRIECLSSLARRKREGTLANEEESKARVALQRLFGECSEIQPEEQVRYRAERLLAVHPLRSADALQLAAALIWAQDNPKGFEFICLDKNLREAADKEGFVVLPQQPTSLWPARDQR